MYASLFLPLSCHLPCLYLIPISYQYLLQMFPCLSFEAKLF